MILASMGLAYGYAKLKLKPSNLGVLGFTEDNK
jgi:hypothetical protein